MRTFTDTAGRTFTLTIDSATAARLREFHRINASGLLFNGAHFAAVTNDRTAFFGLLATLLDDQLRLLRRDAPGLEATMDARTHQAAIRAFAGALFDYLPAGEQGRLNAMLKQAEAEPHRQADSRPRPGPAPGSRTCARTCRIASSLGWTVCCASAGRRASMRPRRFWRPRAGQNDRPRARPSSVRRKVKLRR